MSVIRTCAAAALLGAATLSMSALPVLADSPLGSYIARLSPQDHFNSSGKRLDNAAQVVRQDRANCHRFGYGDPEDEHDRWFGSNNARARLETMLGRPGAMDQATRRAILSGTPVVEVQVYPSRVRVDIIGY